MRFLLCRVIMMTKLKVLEYHIVGDNIKKEDGTKVNLCDYYMEVLDGLRSGKNYARYTVGLDTALIDELFRLPTLPAVKAKADVKVLRFNIPLQTDYCMPVLKGLLSNIIIEHFDSDEEQYSILAAIKKNESWKSPNVRPYTVDIRSSAELEAIYREIKRVVEKKLPLIVNISKDQHAVIEHYEYQMMSTKRKRKMFYFDIEEPATLKVTINVRSKEAPQNADVLKDNSLVDFISSHSGKSEKYITTFIDALTLSTLMPQFISATCSSPKLWEFLYKEELPNSPSKRTIWVKSKIQDVANSLPLDDIHKEPHT